MNKWETQDYINALSLDVAAEKRGWWPILEVEETPFVADNSGCPDCGGKGVGCCINADIPLPGVER